MTHLTRQEIEGIGLASLGQNVLISDKAVFYHPERIHIGSNVRIDDFSILSGSIRIGDFVHIYVYCYLFGGEDGIVINDFSGLAHGVKLFVSSDDYSGESLTNPMIPDTFKPGKRSERILIGRHSIVGTHSVIFPGANLAEGTAVGAMSLVSRPTTPWSIYAGIPARRLRPRSQTALSLERQFRASLQSDGDRSI